MQQAIEAQERHAAAPQGQQTGLSSAEADARLREFGPNDPAPARRRSAVTELLLLFLNPLIIILFFCSHTLRLSRPGG